MARPARIDPCRYSDQPESDPAEDRNLYPGRLLPPEQRRPGAQRHRCIFDIGGRAVAETHADHALIVVLAMRAPDALASDHTLDQRQRRVADERTEYRQGKPQRPHVIAPAEHAERRGEKTERDRADVAEEDARRMEVVEQERA